LTIAYKDNSYRYSYHQEVVYADTLDIETTIIVNQPRGFEYSHLKLEAIHNECNGLFEID